MDSQPSRQSPGCGEEDLLEGAVAGEFEGVEAGVRDREVRRRAVVQLDVEPRPQLPESSRWHLPPARPPRQSDSLIGYSAPLGPYIRTLPRALRWS